MQNAECTRTVVIIALLIGSARTEIPFTKHSAVAMSLIFFLATYARICWIAQLWVGSDKGCTVFFA